MELLPPISHPGFGVKQFDEAVHRAMMRGCRVIETGCPGVLFVTSGSRPGLTYRVTRTSCSCPAGERGIACKHVALACFMVDAMGFNRGRQVGAPATVKFLHRRGSARSAA